MIRWNVPSDPPTDKTDVVAVAKWYSNFCDDGSLRPNLTDKLIMHIEAMESVAKALKPERRFPIQGEILEGRYLNGGIRRIPPTSVPWSDAEIAYKTYSHLFGDDHSLEKLADRSGFGLHEYVLLREGRNPSNGKKVDLG